MNSIVKYVIAVAVILVILIVVFSDNGNQEIQQNISEPPQPNSGANDIASFDSEAEVMRSLLGRINDIEDEQRTVQQNQAEINNLKQSINQLADNKDGKNNAELEKKISPLYEQIQKLSQKIDSLTSFANATNTKPIANALMLTQIHCNHLILIV